MALESTIPDGRPVGLDFLGIKPTQPRLKLGLSLAIRKPIYKDLNEKLINLQEEQKKEWGEGLVKALRAKSVRKEENPVVKGKMNGGTSTTAEAIMDSC